MSKYTLGPWGIIQLPSMQYRVDAKAGPIHVCPAIAHGLPDARLIAAAPDLLEALLAVVSVADRKTVEFDKARAAIAKATGETK